MSEAILNATESEGWSACSAGSQPSGQVNPLSLETLGKLGISTENLWSKTMEECEQFNPEVVVTVYDSAAQKACTLYLGIAIKVQLKCIDDLMVHRI